MSESRRSLDLSDVSVDDIVRELQNRRIVFTLLVAHVLQRGRMPGSDVPSAEKAKVYGSTFLEQHPALKAWFLCEGIQACLNEIFENPAFEDHAGLAVELSSQVQAIRRRLDDMLDELQA
jgi:hypothetical protein